MAVGSAIASTFLLIWVNLAVGLIGGGPNPANLMYIGVVVVVLIGTYLARFSSKGMEQSMFAAAVSLVLVGIVQLLTGVQHYTGASVLEIIGVNAFFATLFAVSGLLFRKTSLEQMSSKQNAD
jgi:heme A synthase